MATGDMAFPQGQTAHSASARVAGDVVPLPINPQDQETTRHLRTLNEAIGYKLPERNNVVRPFQSPLERK